MVGAKVGVLRDYCSIVRVGCDREVGAEGGDGVEWRVDVPTMLE